MTTTTKSKPSHLLLFGIICALIVPLTVIPMERQSHSGSGTLRGRNSLLTPGVGNTSGIVDGRSPFYARMKQTIIIKYKITLHTGGPLDIVVFQNSSNHRVSYTRIKGSSQGTLKISVPDSGYYSVSIEMVPHPNDTALLSVRC